MTKVERSENKLIIVSENSVAIIDLDEVTKAHPTPVGSSQVGIWFITEGSKNNEFVSIPEGRNREIFKEVKTGILDYYKKEKKKMI